jgi:hypothetical protein
MISPRTDALSGFLGVDGKQHRELRWLEWAALCGVRRDEPRTTEFEQKSRKTPSQARRGLPSSPGKDRPLEKVRYQFLSLRQPTQGRAFSG